jgi:hypothetical protein
VFECVFECSAFDELLVGRCSEIQIAIEDRIFDIVTLKEK